MKRIFLSFFIVILLCWSTVFAQHGVKYVVNATQTVATAGDSSWTSADVDTLSVSDSLCVNGEISTQSDGSCGLKWKEFSGTTDGDSETSFAHGIADPSKICGAICMLHQASDVYIGGVVADQTSNQAVADSYRYWVNGANFYIGNVGTSLQSSAYRVVIFYVE